MSKEYVQLKRPSAYLGISCAMDDTDREEYAIIDRLGVQISEFHLSEEAAWDEVAARLRSEGA